MKMYEAKSKKSIMLLTFISLIPVSVASVVIGISSSEVKTSDTFSITCTVSDLSKAIVFFRGTTEIGRCAASVVPGLAGLCETGFSQDITTNITTYTIASANATRDQGEWTCQHPPETSNELNLIVYGFPANPIVDNQAYLPNSIDTANMDSTQFTLNVSECVNPAPTISWTFFQDCEGTSISLIPITSTNSKDPDVACSSPYSAYKNTVTVTDMKNKVNGDYCYKVRALVGYPETSFPNVTRIFTQNITFTSKSPASPESKTGLIIGLAMGCAGIACITVLIFIVCKQKSHQSESQGKNHKLVPPGQTGQVGSNTQLVQSVEEGHRSESQGKNHKLVPPGQTGQVGSSTQLVPSVEEGHQSESQGKNHKLVPAGQTGQVGPSTQLVSSVEEGMPLKPRGPLKIKNGQDHVEFEWKSPKSDGGCQITEYIVEVQGDNFDTWEHVACSSEIKLQVPMHQFKDRGVMSFRVRAKNEFGLLSKPLLAQEPFNLQKLFDLLVDRPVQGRGPAGFLPRNSVGTEHKQGSLLDGVPSNRKLPERE